MPRPVWILAGGSFVNRFGTFVVPFLVLCLRSHGYSAAEAGVALAAYGFGKVAAAPSGGYLADRLGARVATAVSMFLGAATMLALWRAVEFGTDAVYLSSLLAGWASELYRPSVSAAIAGSVPAGASQVTAFALYQLGASVGLALGPVIGGILAAHSFTPLFLGDAATSSVWGILSLMALPRTDSAGNPKGGLAFQGPFRNRVFLRFWISSLLVNVVLFQAHSTLPLWLADHGHASATYGALLGVNAALTAMFQLPLTRWTRRFHPWRMLAVAHLLCGVGFGMLMLGGGIHVVVVAVLVWSAGEILAWPVAAAWVTRHAPPEATGRYAGARSLSFALAYVVAPLVGTALYEATPRILWAACLGMGTFSAVLLATARRDVGESRSPR
jgi:MFS family permease